MLGERQWRWLARVLARPAQLRLIVSSIQVIPEDHGFERWGALPRERARLFELLETSAAEGVVLLSGDRHLGGLYRHVGGLYPVFELTSSSLNRPNQRVGLRTDSLQLDDSYVEENFGWITVDWTRRQVVLTLRDVNGETVIERRISLDDLHGIGNG